MKKTFYTLFSFFLLLLIFSAPVYAWPTDSQWIPVYKGGIYLQDSTGDAQGSRNIVSDPANDAAFIYNDGQYIHFRLRLDQTPAGTGGQGYLKSFGWGVEIDTNLNNGDYEWLMMVDGISKVEKILLQQNSIQATLGDPGDKTESICSSVNLLTNYRVLPANTSINGDLDYFLDWRFPYSTFKQCTGLTDSSPIRLFFGSSSSTNNLTEQGADLVGGSDLYTGFSDYITPFGTRPTTGTVRFVQGLLSTSDLNSTTAGKTIYVRVEDQDMNWDFGVVQSVTVTLTSASGDSETLVLTETGVNTGIFSGAIITSYSPVTAGDGTVQVLTPDEIVTVRYIDLIDVNLNRNQTRTDTLVVLLPPVITVTKNVTPASTAAGGTINYTITITNTGQGEGYVIQVKDLLPDGFSYVSGSTSGLTTDDPSITGQELTWNGNWEILRNTGEVNLSFSALAGSVSGTYYNSVTVSGSNFNIVSTGDTAAVVVAAPQIGLTKSVDKATAAPGEEVIYSVFYKNSGDGSAHSLIVFDTVPTNTTYVTGSMREGNSGSDYASASPLSDAAGEAVPGNVDGRVDGNNIIFTVNTVDPDDSVPDDGTDEGKLYFKVTIN
ncbi:hypothetical protein ACFL6W_06480 [Thermodesulfobacteriota bacterium]